MAIFNLFSKRQRKLRGELPDVYVFDALPDALRTQVVHIWLEILGGPDDYEWSDSVRSMYTRLVVILRKERGVFVLPGSPARDRRDSISELVNYFLMEENVEQALDVIELTFTAIDKVGRSWDYLKRSDANQRATEAIEELNGRFREHGVGYEFVEGEIMRADSQLLHSEVVKPALRLLNRNGFEGAEQEFLAAHEHYRHGRAKEALNECLKALESVMKSICGKRGWEVKPNATAKALIQACFANGLVPSFWQAHFASLRSMLESGVPTGRNKLGGHGQGPTPTAVPEHLVSFTLHMTASAIVFLAESDAKMP